MITPVEAVDVVRRESERFRTLLRTAPHDVPVPHLPGWTVADLGAHLGGDLVWATRVLRSPEPPRSGLRPLRRRGAALCDGVDAAARAMVAALAEAAAAPDAPCWNFADGVAGRRHWWPRHQAHEVTLHRWDLERALGDPGPVDPVLAADGVDELLAVYTRRYRPHRLDAPLALRCTGAGVGARVGAGWQVVPAGDGRVDVRPLAADGPADVTTDPQTLLLLLWRRVGPDDAAVRLDAGDGAVAALRRFLTGPVTA